MKLRAAGTRMCLAVVASLALAGCEGSSGGTEPEGPEIFQVTAFSENLSCSGTTCGVDLRGTARTSAGEFVSSATVFSYVTRAGTQQVAGPSATTNAAGGYVMRYNFPSSAKGQYDVRICAGTEVRAADARCAQTIFILD